MPEQILINRAPVLTLWAAAVAERMGYDHDAALTLGKAMAGLNAQTKGRMLGIYKSREALDARPPTKVGLGEEFWVELCGRSVPAKNTNDGVRAVVRDKPIDPTSVRRYLEQKFGDDLQAARDAMANLAAAFAPNDLQEKARNLYEKFRPEIPRGKKGWGAKGQLDLTLIRSLATEA